jgi:serine/threonine protein phosphatase PrpC
MDFPVMDLQQYYHGKKPIWSEPYPQPQALLTASNKKYGSGGFRKDDINKQQQHAVIVTRRGNKYSSGGRVAGNQDRAISMTAGDSSWSWMGLFDGHGAMGHVMANYAKMKMSQAVAAEVSRIVAKSKSLTMQGQRQQQEEQLLKTTIPAMMERIASEIHHSLPALPSSGTTVISILNIGNKLLFMSNIGDSDAYVVQYNPKEATSEQERIQILYKTKPHKPDDPEEYARIIAAGGEVQPKPVLYEGGSARILIPEIDPVTGLPDVMALAMSRSIGDVEGDKIGKSHLPTTDIIDIEELFIKTTTCAHCQYFVIAASDGLVDKLPIEEVALHMAESWSTRPFEAAEELILKASKIWLDGIFGGKFIENHYFKKNFRPSWLCQTSSLT